MPQFSVIVEPPSPDINEQLRNERLEKADVVEVGVETTDYYVRNLLAKGEQLSVSDVITSNNSSNSNLLGE